MINLHLIDIFQDFLTVSAISLTNIVLKDFQYNESTKIITLTPENTSSAGYIAYIETKSKNEKLYVTFYSINSKIGVKDTFDINVDGIQEVYFSIDGFKNRKVLLKNDNNDWVNVEGYKLVKDLKQSQEYENNILVKFDDKIYAKSKTVIDYEPNRKIGNTHKIGIIDKLVNNEYVPNLNGETNQIQLLNAEVYDVTTQSLILYYNGEYVLFDKIEW